MITDNPLYPKTYEVTKTMDSFPIGTTKVTLIQSHYNEHVDLCGIEENYFEDKETHMICDFYESKILPSLPNKEEIDNVSQNIIWKLSEVNDKLYVNGQPQIIKAIPNHTTKKKCEWHIFVDGVDYTDKLNELENYLIIEKDELDNILTITAINKDLAKYIISIKVYDKAKTYYDFVEMEVCI